MRLVPLAVVVSLAALGCLDPGNVDPDGGRIRVNCDTTSSTWPVEVVDLGGLPVTGADVTATNDTNLSLKVTGKTDSRGIFLVDGKLVGTGPVTVRASFNGLNTNPGRFTFTPSECAGSLVEPRDLRLQLQR
ncbi:MAG: carboxypeptidase regulatory-like domain-containing protein [Myxococcaceae bacterium]|nr:carboxypeptidase regulatory-like domain-containing protein [Myxococcaceae bacterium]